MDRLSELLRGDLPTSIEALPDATRDRLADQIEAARHTQAARIAEATQTAVDGVPLPVRGVVRKALLG
ncbi:MAG: hypothetical protein ACTHMS_17580 [Jatrophihabitans sp.]|uniref:hypothetical protein n=1 Tax=Jatrophihabitans sp. TaxID=1932789 RepID=UPI003F8084EA